MGQYGVLTVEFTRGLVRKQLTDVTEANTDLRSNDGAGNPAPIAVHNDLD